MATLHVRNVPDPVYELLRQCAEANGRSIGAEAIALLQEGIAAGRSTPPLPPFLGRRRRRSGAGLFTTFTHRARSVVVAAQDEARALGHEHVGTGHLLLGLLKVGDGAAARELVSLGFTVDETRAKLLELVPRADAELEGRIPFQPAAKRALELALRESLSLGHDHIGTEHLLLGIVAEGEAPGAQIVASVEPNADKVRQQVLSGVGRTSGPLALRPPPAYRVIDLEGEAADWEEQLNEACANGFELVEVVDRRAILRRG